MFAYSEFYQDLSGWDISNAEETNEMFYICPMDYKYMPKNR